MFAEYIAVQRGFLGLKSMHISQNVVTLAPSASTAILRMIQAIVTNDHLPRTASNPRSQRA